MAITPIEVLIYALVISGKPDVMSCDLKPNQSVQCSNGVTAIADRTVGGMILTIGGKETVKIQAARDGQLLFSNGITAIRLPSGWIKFSNGVETRRDTSGVYNAFLVAPDWICSEVDMNRASCKKR